jgi:hypothetical protein
MMRDDLRRHPWPWWKRLACNLSWLVDVEDGRDKGAPSQAKILAYVFAARLCIGATITGAEVGAWALVISAAYGRSIWSKYLGRMSFAATTTDTTSRTEQRIRTEVVERRKLGAEDDSEPT